MTAPAPILMKSAGKLFHSIRSGSREIVPGNILLAPMAGYTDTAFRHLCTEKGADMCYTEMVSSEALVRNSQKTLKLLEKAENEISFAVQIFCSSPQTAAESLKFIEPFKPSVIDLNCGCPVPKILKSGSGSALMRSPDKIGEIVKTLTRATDIPVSVKLRSGWDSSEITFIRASVNAAEAGASIITLHPRTRAQGYSGKADWKKIMELKREVDIPVIGSGDLFTPLDCINMLETTGCDGIMIARGAVGNPGIFSLVKNFNSPDNSLVLKELEKVSAALRHVELAEKYYSGQASVNEIKKHLCSYVKGIKGASSYRKRLMQSSSMEQYRLILKEFKACCI